MGFALFQLLNTSVNAVISPDARRVNPGFIGNELESLEGKLRGQFLITRESHFNTMLLYIDLMVVVGYSNWRFV